MIRGWGCSSAGLVGGDKPGVGTNRYSYSFNDPVNGRDPGGHAKLGSSFDGHDDEAEKAKKAAEDDRKALLDAAEKARKAKEALLKGKKLGFLDGLLGFGNRITKSYGIDPVRGTPSVDPWAICVHTGGCCSVTNRYPWTWHRARTYWACRSGY